jgi:hypothetical protein
MHTFSFTSKISYIGVRDVDYNITLNANKSLNKPQLATDAYYMTSVNLTLTIFQCVVCTCLRGLH